MPPKGRGKKKVDAVKNTAASNDNNIVSSADADYVVIQEEVVKQSIAHIDEELGSLKSLVEENGDRLNLITDSIVKKVSKVLKKDEDSGDTTPVESKEETSNAQITDEQNCETEPEKAVPSKRGRKAKAKKDAPLSYANKEISHSNEDSGDTTPAESKEETSNAQIVDEQISDKTESEKAVPSKRGRKAKAKKDAPLSDTNKEISHSNEDSGDNTPADSKEETSNTQIIDEQNCETEPEEAMPSKRGRKAKAKKDVPLSDTNKEISHSNEKQNLAAVPKRGRSKNVTTTNVKEISANEIPKEETEDMPETGRSTRNRRDAKRNAAPPENTTSTQGNKRKKVEKKSGDPKKQNKSDPEILSDGKKMQVIINRNHMIDQLALDTISEKEEPARPTKGKRVAKGVESEKPAKVAKTTSTSSRSKKKDISGDVADENLDHQSNSSSGNKWNFKLSSWNVNGIRAWLEKDGLMFLQKENPDAMCVQETKCSDSKLPDNIRKVDGYHCYWLSGDKDGYSGVGLLSKTEPKSIAYGINVEEHDNEGRVITAEYEHFYLVAAYVPNAGRQLVRLSYRIQWDKDFTEYLKKLDSIKPVVLCGDLNVAHEEIDLANPKSNKKNAGFTKEEREGFSNLLSEGFVDTFRHLYPDTKHAYTFWTYMMNSRAKNVGWRLDYFVISKRFVDNLCDSVICKDVLGSDHCPINLLLAV